MRILIIGCGYIGLPLGAHWVAQGHEVYGLRRSPSARAELERAGLRFLQADITDPQSLPSLASPFDAVVNVVSSSKGGLAEYRQIYLEGTKNLLTWLRPHPPRQFLYTSSTSVYGQNDGSWVTEESPASPPSATSQILIDAENELLRAFATWSFPSVILRVGGIYGPGRGHLFQQFLRDEATLREGGENFINSIHLDDVVGAIAHLLIQGAPGQIYNAVDDEPVTQRDFFRWLSETLHKPMPPSAPADPNRKRGLTNKRVSNARLHSTGFTFQHPNFRAGYCAEMRRLGIASDP